jgi:hypothetical protein
MRSWTEHLKEISSLAESQLFFVGGAPRSGTTWLQYLLDSHPEVSCRGEGLFQMQLAKPLEAMMAERSQALTAKNRAVFRHSDGYPLPNPDNVEFLLGTAILLALHHQSAGKVCRAVGEKTPENVFFFERVKRLFPRAKFIGVARDPRDQLTSAWHFFYKPKSGEDEAVEKAAYINRALPAVNNGVRALLSVQERHPADSMIVTYERMHAAPALIAAQLFRFLGVSAADDVVADCVARTSFSTLSKGRPAGVTQNGSFFRKVLVGDWRSTLTPEMNELILREVGWVFPRFGWVP